MIKIHGTKGSLVKVLVFMLVVALTVTVVIGCSKKDDSENSDTNAQTEDNKTDIQNEGDEDETKERPGSWVSDELIEISMLYKDEGSYPYKSDWLIWKAIEEKTNVRLKPVVVPASDYETKERLLLSSGDAPDFLSRFGAGHENEFLPAGLLVAVSDYEDQLVEFKTKVEKWGLRAEIEDLKQLDGKYYVLPGLCEVPWLELSFAYRKDVVDKLGLKVPEDYDELVTFLKALKEEYPDTKPWSEKWNHKATGRFMGPAWGTEWHWGGHDVAQYDRENDTWIIRAITDEYREYLRYMRKLIVEGLFDEESFTHSSEQLVEKISTGKAFLSAANMNEVAEWEEFGRKNIGPEFDFQMMVPPAGPKGKLGAKKGRLYSGVAIPTTTKDKPYFDKVLKFIDWMYYSDEGVELARWGVEGVTFQIVDGKRKPMPDIKYKWFNPDAPKDARIDFGLDNLAFINSNTKEMHYELMSEEEKAFAQKYEETREILPPDPRVKYTPDQMEEMSLLKTKVNDYTNEMYLKFMLGQASIEDDWDKYVETVKSKGATRYVELKNQAYEATKKARQK